MNAMIWILAGIACSILIGWMLYMMTFRTDDWLRLVKDEQERKAKSAERMKARGKVVASIVRAALKK